MAVRAPGFALRFWLALTWGLQSVLSLHLRQRLKAGKEIPDRWREKLGYATATRPEGVLIWMHAVGLGETLALRGLVARLSEIEPNWRFLITSGTRGSAEVLGRNMPGRSIHQFLPLDATGPARRFFDHWSPDMSVWAEQELWPGLVWQADRRGIPLAMVNARMNTRGLEKRLKVRAVYADVLARFRMISAQDDGTARNLKALGAGPVRVDGSLKPVAPDLDADAVTLTQMREAVSGRFVWVLASSHPEDEALALAAHRAVLHQNPQALLIIAPRLTERGGRLVETVRQAGLTASRRNSGAVPDQQVYVADSLGELGIWFRLARAAYIGGTNSEIEGHNPWEAARLAVPVFHGARVAHFDADYRELHVAGGAVEVDTAEGLAARLLGDDLSLIGNAGAGLVYRRMDRLDDLCQQLRHLLHD